MAVAVERRGERLGRPGVAQAAPAVFEGVAVQDLRPSPAGGDADVIIPVRDRGEIADGEDEVPGRAPFAQIADDALIGVLEVDPFEPGLVEICLLYTSDAADE